MANGIIDVHAHVVFDALLGKAGHYGPEVGRDEQDAPFFRVGDYAMKPLSYDGTVFTDLSLRLAELDRLQIDLQVLSPPTPSPFCTVSRRPSRRTFVSSTTR